MPPTEPCIQGAENRANIQALKEVFEDFRDEIRVDIDEIRACLVKITNHYSKKPSWGTAIALVALSNALIGAIMWIITH